MFNFKYVIGKGFIFLIILKITCFKFLGGFGKVWLVEHVRSKKLYAMKEMSKSRFLNFFLEKKKINFNKNKI